MAVACSSMTPRALLWRIHRSRRRHRSVRSLPFHIGDLISRSKMRPRIAMAGQTPPHGQRLLLLNNVHLVDASVALHASDTRRNVHAVVKVHVVWEAVDANPFDRFARSPALAHRLESRRVRTHQRVTVHAGLGWRDHRHRRPLDTGVTITAVNAELPGMQPVTVRNRLAGLISHLRVPWRPVVPDQKRHGDGPEDRGAGRGCRKTIERAGKDLHCWFVSIRTPSPSRGPGLWIITD